MKCTSQYLDSALNQEKVPIVIETLKKIIEKTTGNNFDAIAFQGLSGSLIAPILAFQLNKKMIVLRKENSHSKYKVEGYLEARRVIIIDDLISSGRTMKTIIGFLKSKECEILGVFMYCDAFCNDFFENIPSYAFSIIDDQIYYSKQLIALSFPEKQTIDNQRKID